MQSETGYYSVDLNGCAQNYFKLATLIQKSSLQTVMKKFASSSYKEVSKTMNRKIREMNEEQHNKQHLQTPNPANSNSLSA